MNIQPKTEPGSPPGFTSTNPINFEDKSIQDLVNILRGTYQFETFDRVEGVLVSRDMMLREEIQQLQQNVDLERLKLQEELHFERISRLQVVEDFRKMEELCEKEKKRVQESYESLLKEVKVNGLAERDRIRVLRERNNELECEVKKLKEKCVDIGNEIEMLRMKNDGLESEVLGLREMKGKWEEDSNKLGLLRKIVGDKESEVIELRKLKKKWLDDSDALDELKRKVCVLEDDKNAFDKLEIRNGELEETVKKSLVTISELRKENSKLSDEKRRVEKLLESSNAKFWRLNERVERLESDTILLLSDDASGGRKNKGEPHADSMVAGFEDNDEDVRDNALRNDTVKEDAPLQRDGDAHHSIGVAAGTQPQNKGDKNRGASSGEKYWKKVYTRRPKKTVEMTGSSETSGRLKLEKDFEIILLDDDDDDDDQCMSQGVHEKKAIYGTAVKIQDPTPSSSGAWQQKTKFGNVLDMVKRKISFSDSESSMSTSSDYSSFLDNLTIKSAVSHAKKRKV